MCNRFWSYDLFERLLKKEKRKKNFVYRFTDTITSRPFNVHEYELDSTDSR